MDFSGSLQMAAVGALCAAIGFMVAKHTHFLSPSASQSQLQVDEGKKKDRRHDVDRMAETMTDFKMVLVVRNDLKMGKGKIAAQCSHATLGLYKKVFFKAPKALQRWENCGQVKVVTKVESEDELLLLQAKANSLKIASHITIDAGKTQIAPMRRQVLIPIKSLSFADSRTVMSLLGPSDVIDEVTGSLKLL